MAANEHITISKSNVLPAGQDYYQLREEGISLIQELGSKLWTDYNIHDPGITILEVLCYVITDISYRSSFEVKDLIAAQKPDTVNTDDQTFFTAREILTTAPWTINDYRKLLIDLDGIKNAWIKCSLCNCGPSIYVDCTNSVLTYTKPLPPEDPGEHEVIPKGLYDVLIEFDNDEKYGDLNSGLISSSTNLFINGNPDPLFFDVFFKSLQKFAKAYPVILPHFKNDLIFIKKVQTFGLMDRDKIVINDDAKLRKALRRGMLVSFKITLSNNVTFELKDVPFRLVWLKDDVRGALTISDLDKIFTDSSKSGIISRYLQKIRTTEKILSKAKKCLHKHRNITEDFCNVDEVEVEGIGVCTDMDLAPDADIEQVLANVYYLIGEYLNPEIRFSTLSEMLETNTVDQVFDGPKLSHGFINDDDLERTDLNRTVYSSDIINLLMDIPGVQAVRNFVLVRFDEFGDIKESNSWKLEMTGNKLPRLYIAGSKVLAFKNGLPFLPDLYELMDTMQVIYGNNGAPKLKDTDLDIFVPEGKYYELKDYHAVQNSLPQVYGTGYEGLPSSASDLRRVQAKQLKAYLLFFEQVLVNYFGQLSNLKQLFSISNKVKKTYFPSLLGESDITGVSELYDALDEASLYKITESEGEFADRRNRFLDHLLSRFSESFSDYALLLYSFKNKASLGAKELVKVKTFFLKQFPYQSAYKAQSFDHTDNNAVEIYKDQSGLHHRISALLGMQPSLNFFNYDIVKEGDKYSSVLTLVNDSGKILLKAMNLKLDSAKFAADDRDTLIRDINFSMARLLKLVKDKSNFVGKPDGLRFKIELGSPAIAYNTGFSTAVEADDAINEIVKFAEKNLNDEQFMIVEHILLRPQNVNDALLEVCVEKDCKFCGEEDPYSYSVTFVFNGEQDLENDHYLFRRFAEKTIRAELPAHVLCKICWVKKDVYEKFEIAYVNWLKEVYVAPPVDDKCKTKVGVTNNALKNLICEMKNLKTIYPPATLHDCVDGNDSTAVFLNQTNL